HSTFRSPPAAAAARRSAPLPPSAIAAPAPSTLLRVILACLVSRSSARFIAPLLSVRSIGTTQLPRRPPLNQSDDFSHRVTPRIHDGASTPRRSHHLHGHLPSFAGRPSGPGSGTRR